MNNTLGNYAAQTRKIRLASEVLRCLTTIPKDKTEDPIIEQLRSLYQSYRSIKAESHEYAIVTLINAVLTQKRRFFVLTRRNLEACVRSDKNLPKQKRRLAHEKYSTVIALLHKLGTCKAINAPESGSRSKIVLEVVDSDLVRLLNLTLEEGEEQRQKCLKFSESQKRSFNDNNQEQDKNHKEVIHVSGKS